MSGYNVIDRVQGKRLELRNGDQSFIVDRAKQEVYVPPKGDIRIAQRNEKVALLIGEKVVEMTTPVAVKVGFALSKNGGACMYLGDVVTLSINGEMFYLLPKIAVQVGGGLMLKADKADDWQREHSSHRRLQ